MSDEALVVRARNWEALCLYGWHPYMYNPQLKRWLRRITVPTLVLWGASDGIVTPAYGRAYAARIPGARFELDRGAPGTIPEIEQPDALRASASRRSCRRDREESAMDAWYHERESVPLRAAGRARRAPIPSAPACPTSYCDPKIAADLFEEALDEFLLCDDLGINVVADRAPRRHQLACSARARSSSASSRARRGRCAS